MVVDADYFSAFGAFNLWDCLFVDDVLSSFLKGGMGYELAHHEKGKELSALEDIVESGAR